VANYVFSFQVPADYAPKPETTAEWQAWFSRLGPALVDIGNAVTEYASVGEVGGSGSRMIGYSLVAADDLDAALALAKDSPVMRVGGGVEVGPVMEVTAS
jgi:hypothetical protein